MMVLERSYSAMVTIVLAGSDEEASLVVVDNDEQNFFEAHQVLQEPRDVESAIT